MNDDLLNYVRTSVENLPHCRKLGLKITDLKAGSGEIHLRSTPAFQSNPDKPIMHSGIVTTMLDTLCGTVASTVYQEGRTVATLDLRLDHLATLNLEKDLYGRAECFHCNNDVVFVRAYAWQERKDKLVAKATGSFMVNGSFKLRAGA